MFRGSTVERNSTTLSLSLSTVFLHAEWQEHPSRGGLPTGEWVVTDIAEGPQLGTEQRVREKEAILTSAGIIMYFLKCVQ